MNKILPIIFKAYDIRGIYPGEINEVVCATIAAAATNLFIPKTVVVGRDGRISSTDIVRSVSAALVNLGVEVIDISIVTSDEFYFAVHDGGYDMGIMVTASHNPVEYNGLKFVGAEGKPFSLENELNDIKKLALSGKTKIFGDSKGKVRASSVRSKYIEKLRSSVNWQNFTPKKIVVDPGNGTATQHMDALFLGTKTEIIKINGDVDPSFTGRGPNPILPGALDGLSAKVLETKADAGFAWDSDADRFVMVDDAGRMIPSDFLIALMAMNLLRGTQGGAVVGDIRTSNAVKDIVREMGGKVVITKVGRTFIGPKMAEAGAVFGAEGSGHYYFKDFWNFDSGLLASLHVLDLLTKEGKKLSELLKPFEDAYFLSGEINFKTNKTLDVIEALKAKYQGKITEIDGVRIEFDEFWFCARASNTEQLLRVNIEANDAQILEQKKTEIVELINSLL